MSQRTTAAGTIVLAVLMASGTAMGQAGPAQSEGASGGQQNGGEQPEQPADGSGSEASSGEASTADGGGSDSASRSSQPGSFQGFDFGQVVQTMESSVSPLQAEMDRSFSTFTTRIREAERLLDEGDPNEAVQRALAATQGILQVREKVLGPMWEGQQQLMEQTGAVRRRLARAVSVEEQREEDGSVGLGESAEATLDNIAARIAQEDNPTRKKRLTAHYRTVRNLARIKRMADRLSPDQRQLWMNVLQVLDEAALAHQQVLMGTEVLFAQLEATSTNLEEYLSLMETVDGASELLSVVRGARRNGEGLSGFVTSMNDLQERLGTFNESVQEALRGQMMELDAQIDAIEPRPGDGFGAGRNAAISSSADAELQDRIDRLTSDGPR